MNASDDALNLILRRYREMAMFEDYEITSPVSRGNDNDTPLHMAAFDNDVPALEAMFPYVSGVDVRGGLGYTPLHYAVLSGAVDAARCLIAKGADLAIEGDYGDTPLEMMMTSEGFAELLVSLPETQQRVAGAAAEPARNGGKMAADSAGTENTQVEE